MLKSLKGDMPDITAAQVMAAVTAIIAQAIAWGWVEDDTGKQFLSTIGAVLPVLWIMVDAFIRASRNKRKAAEAAAAAGKTTTTVSTDVEVKQ